MRCWAAGTGHLLWPELLDNRAGCNLAELRRSISATAARNAHAEPSATTAQHAMVENYRDRVERIENAATCLLARSGLREREMAARLLLLAALAGEHLLLIGPPGTGKSALCRSLAWIIREDGCKKSIDNDSYSPPKHYFERLLTRFTVPEELLGPLSLSALRINDDYVRDSSGYLTDSSVAFLDEIFRCSFAMLNTLLQLLSTDAYETDYHNGHRLRCLVAASNNLPEEAHGSGELAALYDRFLLRHAVRPLSVRCVRVRA